MHLPVCDNLYVCGLHLGVPVCECCFMVLVCIFVCDNSMHVCVCMLGQAYVSVHLCIICDLCPNVCVVCVRVLSVGMYVHKDTCPPGPSPEQ